ncbi:MAG: tRNA adenosine(34) deaminase TadA [Actinomycetota bacterium]|nr:tRNA adenosine(34) deaminase TadA [Actinomycetota bacterium]
MRVALAEARAAGAQGDVPVGAVVVAAGEIVGRAGNAREQRADPTAHAEVLALRSAAQALGSWRLDGATLYVTLEPCPMCAGAALLARLERLVYGPQDPRAGAALSLYNIVQDPRLNHRVDITYGVLEEESRALLRSFFEPRRSGVASYTETAAGTPRPHRGGVPKRP